MIRDIAFGKADTSDELRRIRAFHSLGDLSSYSDPYYDMEMVSLSYQSGEPKGAKIKTCYNRLCIVVRGKVHYCSENATREFGPGELFLSILDVPHRIFCSPQFECEEATLFVVPIVPALVSQLYPLIDLVVTGGKLPFDHKSSLGSEIWSYITELNEQDARLDGKRRSALRRIYMKAIYQYGFDRNTFLAAGAKTDDVPAKMVQRICTLYDGKMRMSDVTERLPVSCSVAHRKFLNAFGMSVKNYQRRLRAIHANQLHRCSSASFTKISKRLGSSSAKNLKNDVLFGV